MSEVKSYSLLCLRKNEYPKIKEWFIRNRIPYEPSWYNDILTHVSYFATEAEHERLCFFTCAYFGW